MKKEDKPRLVKYKKKIGVIFAEDEDVFMKAMPNSKIINKVISHGGIYSIKFLDDEKIRYIYKDDEKLNLLSPESKEYKEIIIKYFNGWEKEAEDVIFLTNFGVSSSALYLKYLFEKYILKDTSGERCKIKTKKGKIVIERI